MGCDTMSAAFAVGFGSACGFVAGLVVAGICLAVAWVLVEVVVNFVSWLRSR